MPRRPDLPPLTRAKLAANPIEQFAAWWERAEAEVPLPDAICLATAGEDGAPDARMVLLKGFDEEGFRFHTNYESAKGRHLAANPDAAIVVYWRELDRQVRVRGPVERLSAEESDAYFLSRPPERRVGAWASPQSRPLESRAELDERVRDVEDRFAGEEIPRPEHWGGFVLRPVAVEFWQGQVGRLHDRFLYTREGAGWRIERLGP
ncbi:MAG: pyridoxamine 5'-phosphate oxidase [Solirubrobacterales bacterium]